MIKYMKNLFLQGSHPSRLDLFRFVFSLVCLWLYSSVPWDFYGHIPECAWNPPGPAKVLFPKPINTETLLFLPPVFLTSLAFLSIGLFTRIAAWTCAISFFILFTPMNAEIYAEHSTNAVMLTFFILALSPTLGSQYSLDSLMGINRSASSHEFEDSIWPVRLIQFLFFVMFFAAGVSKLVQTGPEWASAQNIQKILDYTSATLKPFMWYSWQSDLHSWVRNSDVLLSAVGVGTLVIELGALFFFCNQRWQILGLLLISSLQLGIFLVTNITFGYFYPMYLIFIPWERLFSKAHPHKNGKANRIGGEAGDHAL